jgi:hypothetical protein
MDFLHWFTPDRILAVTAIIAGLVAIYYERKLHGQFQDQKAAIEQRFEAQKNSIEQIVLSVHTSYIGKFPLDLELATDLIANAKEDDELAVLVDFLGYGHYSDPDKYERYVKTLKESRARVRLLVYGDEEAKTSIQIQFKQEEYDNKVKNSDTYKKYLDHYQKLIKSPPSGYRDFLNTLIAIQDRYCQELTSRKHIDVRSIAGPPINEAVFYWMICKKEMIFSFPNSYTQKKEFSFKTRDDHLLESFLYQFDNKWANGREIGEKCYSTSPLFPVIEVVPAGKDSGSNAVAS